MTCSRRPCLPDGNEQWSADTSGESGKQPSRILLSRAQAVRTLDSRNRWYDQAAGDFTSADAVVESPAPDSAAGNPFAYAADNPLDLTDPTGSGSVYGTGAQGSTVTARVGTTSVTSSNNSVAASTAAALAAAAYTRGKTTAAKQAAAKAALAKATAQRKAAEAAAKALAKKKAAAAALAARQAQQRKAAALRAIASLTKGKTNTPNDTPARGLPSCASVQVRFGPCDIAGASAEQRRSVETYSVPSFIKDTNA